MYVLFCSFDKNNLIVQLVPVSGKLNCTQWRKLNAYDNINFTFKGESGGGGQKKTICVTSFM